MCIHYCLTCALKSTDGKHFLFIALMVLGQAESLLNNMSANSYITDI